MEKFFEATTLFLAGLTATARQILNDNADFFLGKGSADAEKVHQFAPPFHFFMVEYAFQSIEIDIEEGRISDDIFRDVDKLSAALSKNLVDFAMGFLTDVEVATEIDKSFKGRIAALDSDPWFCLAMPRITDLWVNAEQIIKSGMSE